MFERISLILGRVYTLDREDGQTVTEYALVLAFVALLLGGILVALSGGIGAFVNTVVNELEGLPGFGG
jgi:Flp pilus assembly pilin Flp